MIDTPRLHLRRARIEDAADMFAVFSDPRAMRYWDSLPHTDIAQTRAWLERMVAFSPAETDDFILEHAGRAIGKAGCWRAPEIGFILHPDHWGHGLATEALGAVIPHIFASLPVDRLEADVDPRNAASLRLLGKFGFRETGRAEKNVLVGDEWCDSVYLALERPGGDVNGNYLTLIPVITRHYP
jgi:RimJ/RimL family protein N-acetyltransferase